MQLLLLCLISLLLLQEITCKGMWGSKKKKADDDRKSSGDDDFNQFELKQKLAAAKLQRKMQPSKGTKQSSESFAKLRELINMYVSSMEEFLESPQYNIMINPTSIQALVDQMRVSIPAGNEEMSKVLDMLTVMDSETLKFQIKAGLQYISSYLDQMEDIASDPNQLDVALSQFPPESKEIIIGFMNGDIEPLKTKIMNEPSLDRAIKKMILSFLDGDMESALNGAKRYFKSNPQIMEMTRNQLASNPEMAEMMGISDIVEDKKKWEDAIEDGFDVLGSFKNLAQGNSNEFLQDSLEIDADGEIKSNKFASATA